MHPLLVATKTNVVTSNWMDCKSLAHIYMLWMVGSITTTMYILQMAVMLLTIWGMQMSARELPSLWIKA